MAKQIVWSLRAQKDRKEILTYWRLRNNSTAYVEKLNHLFKEAVKMVADFPQIGKATDIAHIRVKIVRDYLIIYEETESQIVILTIWDTRQNPDKLTTIIK